MSLIQEALRRREADGGRPPESPGDRTEAPSEPVVAATDSSRKEWLALLSVLILVLVVSASAVGLLLFIVRALPRLGSGKAAVVSKPVKEEPLEAISGTLAEAVHPKGSSAAPPAEPAPAEPAGRQAAPVAPDLSAGEAKSTSGRTRTSPEGDPASAATAAVAARQALPEAASRKPPVAVQEPQAVSGEPVQPVPSRRSTVWPPLQVSGIIRQAGGASAAIVNGRIVGGGDMVEGVRVLLVGNRGVWLEFGDERKFLRVGAATGEFR